ncbi:salivary glue protein Sgs-3 [Zeugodacus cucurbitae]|uniref:salivary glue protein Sgs-3 n=1 Tax=Zeugodacus cucurbitae TaxID=28588 RepID=UPI0010A74B9B|nr:salivary glue protein Sgs-3 [Zeugodacus cucurbitae]
MLLSLRQYLYNNTTVILLITLQLFALTHARIISDCDTVASETTDYIPNSDNTCKIRYPYIYCNGEESAYCTQDECLEEYDCESEDINELPDEVDASTTTTAAPATTITESTTVTPTTIIAAFTATTTTTASTTTTTQVSPITTTKTTEQAPVTITTDTQNVKNLCRRGVFATYPYPRNCRYYYRCSNGYFLLQECGYLMSFDAFDGLCKNTKEARCLSRLISKQF